MDFGLFYYCQGRGVSHDQAYAEMLDQIELAETLGFGECWFAEHHFTDYSLLPSPNLMIAAALQRTTRMRFGNYVNVLPFHHPLRLAAEATTLDNLARGRFDFGIGKGVRPGEFTKLGLSFDDAPDMTEEAIDILLKLWREDTVSHDGRFWRFPELSLRPRAFQRPHPPLHMVASRPASAARVGARGWPVAMHFTPTDVVARCVEEYRAAVAARARGGRRGPVSAAAPALSRDLRRRYGRNGTRRGGARPPGLLVSIVARRAAAAGRVLGREAQGAHEPRLGRQDLRRAGRRGRHADRLARRGRCERRRAGSGRRRHAPPRVQLRRPLALAGMPLAHPVRRVGHPAAARGYTIG